MTTIIPKSVQARTHPCFTPLWIANASEVDTSYMMVSFMLLWKDVTSFKSVGGQSISVSILKKSSRLTRSNVFMRSMKAMYSGFINFVYFSVLPQCTHHVSSRFLGSEPTL